MLGVHSLEGRGSSGEMPGLRKAVPRSAHARETMRVLLWTVPGESPPAAGPGGDRPRAGRWKVTAHRRHLDASQLAMGGARALPLFEAEAKARQVASRASTGEQIGQARANLPGPSDIEPSRSRARDQAAATVNVSPRSVESNLRKSSLSTVDSEPRVVSCMRPEVSGRGDQIASRKVHGIDAQNHAAEIVLRAKRRIGELTAEIPKAPARNDRVNPPKSGGRTQALDLAPRTFPGEHGHFDRPASDYPPEVTLIMPKRRALDDLGISKQRVAKEARGIG